MNHFRRCLLLALLLVGPGCIEDLQAVGPGTNLTAPLSSIEVKAGKTGEVFAQVLDANKEGVDGAFVGFVRTDSSRIVWTDAPVGADAISIETASGEPFGIVGRGVARAAFSVPADAETGRADVVAMLKVPGVDKDTIAIRIAVEVTVEGGSDGGGSGGSGGTVAGGGMGAAPAEQGGAGGVAQ